MGNEYDIFLLEFQLIIRTKAKFEHVSAVARWQNAAHFDTVNISRVSPMMPEKQLSTHWSFYGLLLAFCRSVYFVYFVFLVLRSECVFFGLCLYFLTWTYASFQEILNSELLQKTFTKRYTFVLSERQRTLQINYSLIKSPIIKATGGSWHQESIPILINVFPHLKANNCWIVPRETMLLFHISLSADIFWYCILI